jgi:D-alanine--poly(phosphoribitol) ligase subunit 2
MKEQIIKLIYASIDEVNSQNEDDKQLSKTETTVIFGKGSTLDSLGLVNLIVSLEQAVNDEFEVEITLADERAMSQENSPFKTVTSLADYIISLVEAEK